MSSWTETFKVLKENGYEGGISIEMEDRHYSGSDELEQEGIIQGARFLASCWSDIIS